MAYLWRMKQNSMIWKKKKNNSPEQSANFAGITLLFCRWAHAAFLHLTAQSQLWEIVGFFGRFVGIFGNFWEQSACPPKYRRSEFPAICLPVKYTILPGNTCISLIFILYLLKEAICVQFLKAVYGGSSVEKRCKNFA